MWRDNENEREIAFIHDAIKGDLDTKKIHTCAKFIREYNENVTIWTSLSLDKNNAFIVTFYDRQ